MEGCDVLLAQSLTFNAVDYARELGFSPNADFHESLLGPRPEVLLATPWSRPEKPIYVSGPDDDALRIMAQLQRATGGNFEHGDPFEELAELGAAEDFELLDEDVDEDAEDEGSEGSDPARRVTSRA